MEGLDQPVGDAGRLALFLLSRQGFGSHIRMRLDLMASCGRVWFSSGPILGLLHLERPSDY
jgi:hypothetical protein